MANQAFSTLATNPLKAQPVSAAKIILRSTDVSDDANLAVYGTVSASPDYEIVGMAGLQETETTASFSALSQVISDAAAVGVISGRAPGVAAVGDIRTDSQPLDGDTLGIGFVGNLITYRLKNTPAAAYDVQIGATIADTTENLALAINAGGTPGSEYYAGTLINPFVAATYETGVMTLTDRLACNRQVAWEFSESAASFSKRLPIGGEDGLLLFEIPAGVAFAADPLTFSAEGHTGATLPALMTGTSPSVAVNGGAAMVRIWGDESIKWKIESSTDLINWHPTSEGEQTLTADTLTSVVLAQLHEYIRFVVTENTNASDVVLDARVVW